MPIVHETLATIAAEVDPAALRATITRLVAFGTRHTLSDTVSDTRGIGAARRWAKDRFEAVSADYGGRMGKPGGVSGCGGGVREGRS